MILLQGDSMTLEDSSNEEDRQDEETFGEQRVKDSLGRQDEPTMEDLDDSWVSNPGSLSELKGYREETVSKISFDMMGSSESMSTSTEPLLESCEDNLSTSIRSKDDFNIRLKFLFHDIKKIISRARKTYIVDKSAVHDLTSDDLRAALSQENIIQSKNINERIIIMQSELDYILIHGEENLTTEILKEITFYTSLCEKFDYDLSQSFKELRKEARERNINTDGRQMEPFSQLARPVFDGNDINLYEFLILIKNYAKSRMIPSDTIGKLITECCKESPKMLLDREFPLDIYPPTDQVISHLKKWYGKKLYIIKSYISQHQEVGKLSDNIANDLKGNNSKAKAHYNLFKKIDFLRDEDIEIVNDDYLDAISSLLPEEHCFHYGNFAEDNESIALRYTELKRQFSKIVSFTFNQIQRGCM